MDAVTVESRSRVAVVRLNRPGNRNALSAEIKAALEAAIPMLVGDPAVGCIVITGSGGAFCAGGDLGAMHDRGAEAVRQRMGATHAWAGLLLTGETPVVAAVNGAAAGAGFSLAMLCDIVLMSDDAYFQAGFARVGAVPDLGLALTLPRAIGMARAKELLLTNRRVGAEEAVAMGIAVRRYRAEDLEAEALAMAETIAEGPRPSTELTKLLLNRAYEDAEGFLREERLLQAVAFGSADFNEGVAAFLAKRKPVFGGSSSERVGHDDGTGGGEHAAHAVADG